MSGYLDPAYAESLREFGRPRQLPRSGGWLLERPIPGSADKDAMGCYPVFCCQDWTQLSADLADLGDEWVALSLVTDPFGAYDVALLKQCFDDRVRPFKEHYVVDLTLPSDQIGGPRRRKHARRALRDVRIEASREPAQFLDQWVTLYGVLTERHRITGIQAFSRQAFAKQLGIPGTTMLRALSGNTLIGAQVYFRQGDVVHCHLGAVNQAGYDLGAFYALDWFSIEYFADQARWLNLGGGVGLQRTGLDGLSQYKQGWATDTRTTYFCGRVCDPDRYAEISRSKNTAATAYFPAYRQGEFR